MKWIVYFLAVIVFILHQDFWNFTKADVVWGFLPIAAAYHMAYSVACAVLMALLVKFAWPKHLEKYEDLPPRTEAQSVDGAFEILPKAQRGGH